MQWIDLISSAISTTTITEGGTMSPTRASCVQNIDGTQMQATDRKRTKRNWLIIQYSSQLMRDPPPEPGSRQWPWAYRWRHARLGQSQVTQVHTHHRTSNGRSIPHPRRFINWFVCSSRFKHTHTHTHTPTHTHTTDSYINISFFFLFGFGNIYICMYARINTAFGNAVPLPAELSTESGQKNTICEFFFFPFSFFFFFFSDCLTSNWVKLVGYFPPGWFPSWLFVTLPPANFVILS